MNNNNAPIQPSGANMATDRKSGRGTTWFVIIYGRCLLSDGRRFFLCRVR